jgi:hypothetical protein
MAYRPIDSNDQNNYLKDNLLQILNYGVNQIVINLKQYLGNDTLNVDINAQEVLKALEDLQNDIIAKTNKLKNNPNNRVILDDRLGVGKIITFTDKNMYNEANPNRTTNINTLDTYENNNEIIPDKQLKLINQDGLPNNTNLNIIQTRLNNCQTLEVLYLRKHEELMKTFAFTINLFDKYKYSVKMILYLLKNLVDKDMPGPKEIKNQREVDLTVNLPKPIIKNIQQLLEDQRNVQGVITDMDDKLIRDKQQQHLESLTNFRQDRSLTDDIKTPTAIKPTAIKP